MENRKSFKIYGKYSCGYCRRLVERLRDLNMTFYVEFLDESPNRLAEMKKKYNHKTVPIVIVRDPKEKFIGGHDDTIKYLYKDYRRK